MNKDILSFHNRIDNARLTKAHLVDGSSQPTEECKELAKQFINYILNMYNIYPTDIEATVDDGIYLTYEHKDRRLLVEVYNDLSIAALVREVAKEEILEVADINVVSEIHNLIFILLSTTENNGE